MRVEIDPKKNEALKDDRKIQIDIYPESEKDVEVLRELNQSISLDWWRKKVKTINAQQLNREVSL